MDIYLIKNQKLFYCNSSFLNFESSSQTPLETHPDITLNLHVDQKYLRTRFGYDLSSEDRLNFLAHRSAWLYIRERKSNQALIIENDVQINVASHELDQYIADKLQEEWDIIFPYDKSNYLADNNRVQPCLLGIYWGSHVYFIKKRGAEKLIQTAKLRQNVGDEIILLSLKNNVSIYTDGQNNLFNIVGYSYEIPLTKKQDIYDSIMGRDVMTRRDRKLLKKLIKILHEVSFKNGVPIFLFAGTLLGHIRHGKRIPWDDDIDFSVQSKDIDKLIDALSKFENVRIQKMIRRYSYITKKDWYYYKIWFKTGKRILGYEHTFPFIDLWLFDRKEDKVEFLGGEVFNESDYFPGLEIEFEGGTFYAPQNPQNVLDNHFRDWRTSLRRATFNHKKEKNTHFPVELDIRCDDNGKIIGLAKID